MCERRNVDGEVTRFKNVLSVLKSLWYLVGYESEGRFVGVLETRCRMLSR